MKKYVIIAVVTLMFSAVKSQSKSFNGVPENVSAAFKSKYPTANLKSWKKQKDGNFTAKFREENHNHFAYFNGNGDWVKTETRFWLTNKLPSEVQAGWKKTIYRSWMVQRVRHIESKHSDLFLIRVTNNLTYDAEHLPQKYTYDLYFSKSGELVKKEDKPWGSKAD